METFKDLLVNLNACSSARKWAGDMPIKEVVEKCHRGDWLLWLAQNVNVDFQKLTLVKGYCTQTIIHLMKDERSVQAVQAAIDYGNGLINNQQLKDAAAAAYAAAAVAAVAAADADAAVYAAVAAADAAAAAYAAAVAAADAAVADADAALSDAAAYAAYADAADAAADAAYAAAADAAVADAHAAAYAADTAAYASYAVDAAAYAAYADAAADAAAHAADAKIKNQQLTADICRKYIGEDIIKIVNNLCYEALKNKSEGWAI